MDVENSAAAAVPTGTIDGGMTLRFLSRSNSIIAESKFDNGNDMF